MQSDLSLVVGLVLAVFAVPSIVSSLSDGRAPRVAIITVLVAGGLVLYALQSNPGGYALTDVPEAFVRVVAQIIN